MSIKKLKATALFMIMLVIALPIYSASVFAGIAHVSITGGTDGIEDFIRDYDWINFLVDLSIPDDSDITPDQIKLMPSGIEFDSCTGPNLDGTMTCTLRFPGVDAAYFMGTSPYFIAVYEDGQTDPTYQRRGYIVVDNKDPVVTSFSITPKLIGSQNITFSYAIEDYAYTAGDRSICVGIGRIEFYNFDASFVHTIDIDTDDCMVLGSINIETSQFAEGGNVIYAKAFDRFEQESDPKEDSFTIDRTAPGIDAASFEIVDAYGNIIDYAGVDSIDDELSVDINGSDLDVDSIVADLSELNVDRVDYGSVKPTRCIPLQDVTRCTWSISIKLDSSGPKNVYINASDYSGNKATATLSQSFVFDDMGPVVTEIKTDRVYGGVSHASTLDNTFIASIAEPGIGFDAEDIFLYVGDARLTADYCDTGACYWYDVGLGRDGIVTAMIGDDSTDRLGNRIDLFTADIVVDSTSPSLVSLLVTNIGGALPAYDYVKTLDSLEITAEVIEGNVITEAYADFSSIIDGASKVLADDCTKTDSTYTCSWTTSSIDVAGYIDDFIYFNFTDAAGNSLRVSEPIEVYELMNVSLDYWKSKVSCSPKVIDRQTTALVNHRIFCHVKLIGDAETIDMNLEECTGPSEYLAEDPVLINGNPGSTDPYVRFTLSAEEIDIDKLDYNCKLRIISKISKKITRYPEIEEFAVPVRFYNMPLGSYGDGVDKKIEDAKEFAWYIGDWIENVNKILHYGEMICNIAGTLAKLYGTLSAIGAALGIGEKAQPSIRAAREKVQTAQEGLGGLTKKQFGGKEGFQKFCKFFSCRLLNDPKWGEDDESIGTKIGRWQHTVLKGANWVATGGERIPGLQAWTNIDTNEELNLKGGKLNPKDSIIISTLTLCLPGIVYNLNKLRQIQCMYVDCLQNYASYGLPLSACEEQKEYATCKYWWGELFQLLPFTGLFNAMIGLVKRALSSPLGFLDMTLAYVCTYKIKSKDGTGAQICLINDMAGLIADVYSDLEGLGEQWEIKDDYCKNI